mmetsp:Transcript_23184/g.48109  ORF Transcript_23184/g.48109 Transcript_23184/m.48109 type:complete len:296 (-) Transcript_23184:1797-2684(-)
MRGRQQVVSGDHRNAHPSSPQGPQNSLGVLPDPASECDKATKGQIALTEIPFTRELRNLSRLNLLVSKTNDSQTLLRQGGSRGIIFFMLIDDTLSNGFGRTLDNNENPAVIVLHYAGHALELGGEVMPMEDGDLLRLCVIHRECLPLLPLLRLCFRTNLSSLSLHLPPHRLERGALEGISGNLSVDENQTIATCEDHAGGSLDLRHGGEAIIPLLLCACGEGLKHTHGHKLIGCESSSLIKKARVYLSGYGNAGRVSAEDLQLHKRHKGVIHSKSLLHRELRRNHGGDDEDAVEK